MLELGISSGCVGMQADGQTAAGVQMGSIVSKTSHDILRAGNGLTPVVEQFGVVFAKSTDILSVENLA